MYQDTELMHYGVKGMKWGVRRYQNKNGSLTSVGKERERKLRNYRAVEKSLSDDEYDHFYARPGAHKQRMSDKAMRNDIDYLERHNDVVKFVADKGSLVFISDQGKEWEAGWATAPSSRGKGITQETIQKGIDFVRQQSKKPIAAYIADDNIASMKVAEKAGFHDSNQDLNIRGVNHKRYVYSKR